ncbi:MAG: hypothetical protein FIB01_09985 [Gemmatimonadetes bacterium]|nr:hypothetical protein [Gemmatimonadota bacterium]
MGWFRPDRTPRPGDDPWLTAKTTLFVAGAAAAILGIGLQRGWLINLAIAIVAAGILLRFLPRNNPPAT